MKKFQFKVYEKDLQDYLDIQTDRSEFIRSVLDDYRTGILLRKEDIEYNEELQIEKLRKIKKENLRLDLNNWKELKSSGYIFEEIKAIVQGTKELETPQLQNLIKLEEPRLYFRKDNHCDFCKHYHANSEPKVCTLLDCNCGIRG